MELTRHAAIFTLVSTVLGLAAASHFRGSIIQWKPVDPDNFDGRVSINAVCRVNMQRVCVYDTEYHI